MKIAIGADHRGYQVKNSIGDYLKKEQYVVIDCGTNSDESCDYPGIAYAVAKAVQTKEADYGILICNSGIGMAIVANKVSGIRAALCHNENSATLSKQHNNANVLVLAAGEISSGMNDIIKTWLNTKFEGGRHERRVNQITDIETRV
ncbi:MAG: ribose 5-phosphate isomerase B [Candidatus Omnitrophota bacterium]|jgi:ribose 5-phosphate isomerase B